jgi:hypothetical protein
MNGGSQLHFSAGTPAQNRVKISLLIMERS